MLLRDVSAISRRSLHVRLDPYDVLSRQYCYMRMRECLCSVERLRAIKSDTLFLQSDFSSVESVGNALSPCIFFRKIRDFDVTFTDVHAMYTRTTPRCTTPVLPSSRRDSHALSHHSLLLILPRRGDMMAMTTSMTSMQLLEP